MSKYFVLIWLEKYMFCFSFFQELRVGDYIANRKGKNYNTCASGCLAFGTPKIISFPF